MSTLKTLALALILLSSLIGFDNIYAAGDLTRRTEKLPDLLLGSEASDYSLSQSEYQQQSLGGLADR